MKTAYIVAIVISVLFFALLAIYWLVADRTRQKEEEKLRELENAYKPANLKKMEYDLAFYDDGTAMKMISGMPVGQKQVTIDDLISSNKGEDDSDAFANKAVLNKIANDEGIEEITGHYNPEN